MDGKISEVIYIPNVPAEDPRTKHAISWVALLVTPSHLFACFLLPVHKSFMSVGMVMVSAGNFFTKFF